MRARRIALALVPLAAVAAGYLAAGLDAHSAAAWARHLLQAIRTLGASGWFGLVAFQIVVAVSGILPASLAGVMGGALYGLWIGFGLAAIGTFAGALLAFWFSRSFFRPLVARMLRRSPRALNLDAALSRDGWKLVCLLRVSPVTPFAATSYALGLSSVSWRDYALGTLAALPALFGYVLLGTFADMTLAGSASASDWLHWVLLGTGSLATIALTIHVGRLAARSCKGAS